MCACGGGVRKTMAVTSKDVAEREQAERAELARRGEASMAAAIANAGGGTSPVPAAG